VCTSAIDERSCPHPVISSSLVPLALVRGGGDREKAGDVEEVAPTAVSPTIRRLKGNITSSYRRGTEGDLYALIESKHVHYIKSSQIAKMG
jgi:hypothetical protein